MLAQDYKGVEETDRGEIVLIVVVVTLRTALTDIEGETDECLHVTRNNTELGEKESCKIGSTFYIFTGAAPRNV